VERLLLFVALLTGIAPVSLDWSWMQFPTAGLQMSRQALELLCRLGACSRVIAEISDQLSNTGFVICGLIAFVWWLYVFARWDVRPDVYLGISQISKQFYSINCNLRTALLTFRHRASYIYRTTAPLTSRCCILYIYSTNINTFFLTRCNVPFFSLQNAVYFVTLNV
jgi:hypothetical protein